MRHESRLPSLRIPSDRSRRRDPKQWWEVIDAPDRVDAVLTALSGHKCKGQAQANGKIFEVQLAKLGPNTITLDVGSELLPGSFDVALQGAGAVYLFKVRLGEQKGDKFIAPRPVEIAQYRQRWSRRCTPDEPLRFQFADPATGKPRRGYIRDVSHNGLSIEPDAPLKLSPGQKLQVGISLDGRETFPVNCEVRHIYEEPEDGQAQIGLKILDGGLDYLRWSNLVDDFLYPNTKVGPEYLDGIWDVYGRCGYFLLCGRTQEGFERMQRAYQRVHTLLANLPQIFKETAWVDKNTQKVIGTVAVAKIYSGTWLGMQFAKLPGNAPDGTSGREVLTEMVTRAFEHLQKDPELAWGHMTVFKDVSWVRHAFYEYVDRMQKSENCSISPFRALELTAANPINIDGHYPIGRATSNDLTVLHDFLLQNRSMAYREALDLVPERFDMSANKALWNRNRLERDRNILVARAEDGRPIAAAVVELAAEGVHISQFLNLVRLYPLEPGGEEAFGALLLAAQNWLDEYEVDRFITYLEDDIPLDQRIQNQMIDFGASDMLFCTGNRIPELIENIYHVAAPKLLKD